MLLAKMFIESRAVAVALAVGGVSLLASRADAANLSINSVFNGPITDGGNAIGTAPGVSAFLFLEFNPNEAVTAVRSVTLDLNHSYAGDLVAALRYLPNGYSPYDATAPYTDVLLFDTVGEYDPSDNTIVGTSNNFSGSYTLSNTASQTLNAAAQPDTNSNIPTGTYLPFTYDINGNVVTVDISTPMIGKSLADGDFYLVIADYFAGDQGTLNSATLNLTTAAVPEPASIAALGLAGVSLVRRRK